MPLYRRRTFVGRNCWLGEGTENRQQIHGNHKESHEANRTGLLLSGKTRLSSCSDVLQCSKPEPTDECWKLMVQYIQDDGNEGRVFPPKDPFPSCCPEVRNLGEECFWYWVDHENGKIGYGRYDVEVIFFQTSNAWTLCHQML